MRCLIFIVILFSVYYPFRLSAKPLPPEDTSRSSCFEHAEKRLIEAFGIMQKHYYKKGEVNWDSLMQAAKQRLSNAVNCEEALETVNWCFRLISESHSYLMPAAKAAVYTNDRSLLVKPSLTQVVGEIRTTLFADQGIAYLSLPWMSTSDEAICTMLADSIQGAIELLDQGGINKWIIDLRENTGGNCWPMIAGLGPLLGEGVCGYFVSEKEKLPIQYQRGMAMQGKYPRCQVSRKPYQTRHDKNWIIVLTGSNTASSGEIIALAFKGKDQAYLYGQPTAGRTTANASYPLSDKSLLVLTVCQEADRFGNLYSGPIMPDELVSPERKYTHEDPAKSAAIMWLQMQ